MFLSETVAQLQQNHAIIKEVTSYRDIYIQFISGAINLSAPPQTFSVISIYKKRSGQGYFLSKNGVMIDWCSVFDLL